MKTGSDTKEKEISKVKAGAVLFAQPFWKEDIYQHSVILVLEHNPRGTTGIIINKHSNKKLEDALPEIGIAHPLFFGGLIDGETISYLHSNADMPESIYLGNDLFWGGSFEAVEEMMDERKLNLKEINFYAGFVQWIPGELDEEINNNKWWVCEMNAKELFSAKPGELWSEGLENCGHVYYLFNNIPDPCRN